jgi:hypothetical protein
LSVDHDAPSRRILASVSKCATHNIAAPKSQPKPRQITIGSQTTSHNKSMNSKSTRSDDEKLKVKQKEVSLGNRTSLCFYRIIEQKEQQRRAIEREHKQCQEKETTAIIQNKKTTPMYKMQKICPQFRYCFRREAKRGSHHLVLRQTATTRLERERKQKPGPKGIIWSITDISTPPIPQILPCANSMFCTIFSSPSHEK